MNLVLWLIVKLLHRPVVCANFQGLDANTFPQLAEFVKAIVELNFNVRKRLSETTLAAADRAKAASPTPDITLYYWVSKLHRDTMQNAMSSRE